MRSHNKIDCVVFLSKEDDKYLVLGGIGTYIGVLSNGIKKINNKIEIFWITQSHRNKDFEEVDEFGVKRIYISGKIEGSQQVPYRNLLEQNSKELTEKILYNKKITREVQKILTRFQDKNVVIESGEWEGLAAELFSSIQNPKVAKIVRLHTPLATCIKQNHLPLTPANNYQLLQEDQLIRSANFISACTEHVKDMVMRDVLGSDSPLGKGILVIPNPIDAENYFPNSIVRERAIKQINKVLGNEFLNDSTYNIFLLGSVEERKGVKLVIEAIKKTILRVPNARFCFIGHCGDDKDKNLNANTKLAPKALLATLPKKYHSSVAFTDYIHHSRVPLIIQAGDVFPIMSIGDNFPGSVVEISLSAKPIIALERGGVKEMLSDDSGKLIALSAGKNLESAAQQLSKKLIFLASKPEYREEIGSRLRNLMLHKFSPDKTIHKILSQYKTVLENNSKRLKLG